MMRCTNCGISVGGKYTIVNKQTGEKVTRKRIEQSLHDFHGRHICHWCLSLIIEQGWIVEKKNNDKVKIRFLDGSEFEIPVGIFELLDRDIPWWELKDEVATLNS